MQEGTLEQQERDGHHKSTLRGIPRAVLFALGFLKHPNMVGWLLPSSTYLVKQVLRQVDWTKAKVIVEYGPGVGNFTTQVLERLAPDGRLIALEINPDFFRFLKKTIQDPRLVLVQDSAAEIDRVLHRLGYSQVDYVISGIPFKTLPEALREVIVQKTYSILRPAGQFLVYQMSTTVVPHLERVFGKVSRAIELRNLIPARLFYCSRPA